MRYVATNQDLAQSNSLTYDGTQVRDSYNTDLDGMKSVMYKNASNENEFKIVVSGTIKIKANTPVSASDKMTFNLTYKDPGISEVYGFFGNEKVAIQKQTIDMSGFSEFGNEGLSLFNPSINLITSNTFGIDMEVSFDEMKAIKSDGSEILLIEKGTGIDGLIESPLTPRETKLDTVSINRDNSNIDALLNATPVSLEFSIGAIPNPTSSTRTSNFLLSDSKIDITTLIIIPLNVKMSGFSYNIEPFSLDELDIEGAESIKFHIISTNEIPFNGSIDLDFLNGDKSILKKVGAARIDAPSVGANGRVESPRVTEDSIELNKEEIDAFLRADQVKATANISTFEEDKDRYVKIYADYTLEIRLALEGQITQKIAL